MTRDCPECGEGSLLRAVEESGETVFSCIQCEYYCDEDDAPEPTGSVLDVSGDVFGRVQIQIPGPRRGMDTRPIHLSPGAARRFAEALEVAARDAERRGEDEDDGGKKTPL